LKVEFARQLPSLARKNDEKWNDKENTNPTSHSRRISSQFKFQKLHSGGAKLLQLLADQGKACAATIPST
jgi:hypothetical protein